MGHHLIHDHEQDGVAGAVSVASVKYTTARGVAEQVVDLVAAKLGAATRPCRTGTTRLPHWDFGTVSAEADRARAGAGGPLDAACLTALVGTHGTAWEAVLARCAKDSTLAARLAPDIFIPAAAVVHAVEAEMAVTLADVVVRRLPLGAAAYPGDDVVNACGALMSALCGWDAERLAAEIDAVRDVYRVW
jgi:glycerol-3-phosphate dehydrogenase